MMLEIIISEPWDFKSSDGDNFLKVKVLKRKKGVISAKALSNYSGKEGYLIITPRNNSSNINICQKSEKHYNVAVGHATKKLIRTIYRMELTGEAYRK